MFAGHGAWAVARLGRLARKSGWALIGTALTLSIGACFPPPSDVVVNPETGDPVLVSDIDAILNNANLTEDQKRQKLLDMGLTEELIDTLIRAS